MGVRHLKHDCHGNDSARNSQRLFQSLVPQIKVVKLGLEIETFSVRAARLVLRGGPVEINDTQGVAPRLEKMKGLDHITSGH